MSFFRVPLGIGGPTDAPNSKMDWTDTSFRNPSRVLDNSSMDFSYATIVLENSGVQQPHSDRTVGYRGVLHQMSETTGSRGTTAMEFHTVDIRSFPDEVKEHLEEKYHENLETVSLMDRSFLTEAQAKLKYSVLSTDMESFKCEAVRDFATVSRNGFPALLQSQRANILKLKSSQPAVFCEQNGDRHMTVVETEYSRALRECNECILCSKPFNSADIFFEKIKTLPDQYLLQLWKTFRYVISTVAVSDNEKDRNRTSFRDSAAFAESMVTTGRNFLESYAFDSVAARTRNMPPISDDLSNHANMIALYAKNCITKHKVFSPPGGRICGIPAWMLIFHSLRVGDVATAIEFANQGDSSTKAFVHYLQDYNRNQRRLNPEMERELRSLYDRQLPALKEDPYKQACYAIIARVDFSENDGQVVVTVSDWLWLKLSQVNGKFSLQNLQTAAREKFVAKSFDDLEVVLVYFLTGQFEAGIERLARVDAYRIHAVHMAVCVKQRGLLLLSNSDEMSSLNSSEFYRLDFVALVDSYTAEFRKRYPDVACEYYFQFGDIVLTSGDICDYMFDNFFELHVWKLAKDLSGDMDKLVKLFGDARVDTNSGKRARTTGIIYKFLSNPENLITTIAEDFDRKGFCEAAVALYETAGQMKALSRALLRELCDVTLQSASDSRRTTIKKLAANCIERLHSGGQNGDDLVMANISVMLSILAFYELNDKKECGAAVQILDRSRLIPSHMDSLRDTLELYEVSLLPDVKRCIPEVLLYAARALIDWYHMEKLFLKDPGSRFLGSPVGTDLSLQVYFRDRLLIIVEFCRLIPLPQCPDLVQILLNLESQIA